MKEQRQRPVSTTGAPPTGQTGGAGYVAGDPDGTQTLLLGAVGQLCGPFWQHWAWSKVGKGGGRAGCAAAWAVRRSPREGIRAREDSVGQEGMIPWGRTK